MARYLILILSIPFVFGSCSKERSNDFQIEILDLCGSRVELVRHFGTQHPKVIWLNVHEDERTSIQALWNYLDEEDISFAYLHQNSERRLSFNRGAVIFTVDPNRIYTINGIGKTLEDTLGFYPSIHLEVGKFSSNLLEVIKQKECVITLHNNTENNYGIQSYMPDSSESSCTEDLYINSSMDPDDFVYTTVPGIFNKLKSQHINVILQSLECTDDGSLSVFCGKHGINYLNIETQHGHLDMQLKLMRIVSKIIGEMCGDE